MSAAKTIDQVYTGTKEHLYNIARNLESQKTKYGKIGNRKLQNHINDVKKAISEMGLLEFVVMQDGKRVCGFANKEEAIQVCKSFDRSAVVPMIL